MANINKSYRKIRRLRRLIRILLSPIIIITIMGAYYFLVLDRETKPVIAEGMDYEIDTQQYANRNVFVVSPKSETKTDTIIIYFHGGGYVEEMSPEYWEFIEKIVDETGITMVVPDYPLAPKYNYIDVFNMIEPMYMEMIQKIDPNDIIFMGDSAGGGMALALVQKLTEQNISLPIKTILISPWLDVTMQNIEIEKLEKIDNVLKKEVLRLAGITYAGGEENTNNYLISPIYGDLSNVGDVIIFTGTYDILNPDVHKIIDIAAKQGTQIKLYEYEGAKHIWLIKNNTDESITLEAYKELINQVKSVY